MTGQPLREQEGIAKILSLDLAIYSVVVLASLAGMLGAYFPGSEKKSEIRTALPQIRIGR